MTVEQWMIKHFKHDKPENSRYNGEYRQDRVKYWQVYDRWVDSGNDVDKLWSDYEQGCMWELMRMLPKEFLTREVVLQICEDVIEHFGMQKVKNEYWWTEKDGVLKSSNDSFGWVKNIGSLEYDTGIRERGIYHKSHPDFWNVIWKHIPKISEVIERSDNV